MRLQKGEIRQTIHINNIRMLMSAFFKQIFEQNFKTQRSIFMKHVMVM